jgi:hypothetical protein
MSGGRCVRIEKEQLIDFDDDDVDRPCHTSKLNGKRINGHFNVNRLVIRFERFVRLNLFRLHQTDSVGSFLPNQLLSTSML